MYKTHDETTNRILSMSSQAEERERIDSNECENGIDSDESSDKREASHITVVPFNPVQTGSFQ